MNSYYIETIGYVATIFMAVSLTPQIVKSWRTKSTKDISISWTLIYLTGLVIWVVYGIGISSFHL